MCEPPCIAPVWDAKEKVLVFEQQQHRTYARGLTKTIEADFMPTFSVRDALQSLPTRKRKKHGRREGNLVDSEVTRWANDGFIACNDARLDLIRAALADREWIPIAAQYPVGCRSMRLATKVDLVCRRLDGSIVLVELKCGFDDYFDVAQGCMLHPFQTVGATLRNRSFLQLMLTAYMFQHCKHRLSDKPFAGAYLLHVFESDAGDLRHTIEEAPAWTRDDTLVRRCVAVLTDSRSTSADQRARVLRNAKRRKK